MKTLPKHRQLSIKNPRKTDLFSEQIAPEEIANEDFLKATRKSRTRHEFALAHEPA